MDLLTSARKKSQTSHSIYNINKLANYMLSIYVEVVCSVYTKLIYLIVFRL